MKRIKYNNGGINFKKDFGDVVSFEGSASGRTGQNVRAVNLGVKFGDTKLSATKSAGEFNYRPMGASLPPVKTGKFKDDVFTLEQKVNKNVTFTATKRPQQPVTFNLQYNKRFN